MNRFVFVPFFTLTSLLPSAHLQAAPAKPAVAKKVQATRADIQSVLLCKNFDGKPQDITTQFSPTDRTLHAVVTLDQVSSGDHIKIIWIIENAGGVKNYRFARKVLTTNRTKTVHFSTVFKGNWPVGKYRVDVYSNGMRSGQAYFWVQ